MDDEDPPNWAGMVERHAERVFRIAYRILGSAEDAEDVSQQVFVEVKRLQESLSIQSWTGMLSRMTTMRSIDLLRKRRRYVVLDETHRVSNVEPYHHAVGNELAQWLRNAVAELPEQQAAVFSLIHFEQLDRSEVAGILSISVDAVSTALYKARVRLQEQLKSMNWV